MLMYGRSLPEIFHPDLFTFGNPSNESNAKYFRSFIPRSSPALNPTAEKSSSWNDIRIHKKQMVPECTLKLEDNEHILKGE